MVNIKFWDMYNQNKNLPVETGRLLTREKTAV